MIHTIGLVVSHDKLSCYADAFTDTYRNGTAAHLPWWPDQDRLRDMVYTEVGAVSKRILKLNSRMVAL
jgi:hypothetical protein